MNHKKWLCPKCDKFEEHYDRTRNNIECKVCGYTRRRWANKYEELEN